MQSELVSYTIHKGVDQPNRTHPIDITQTTLITRITNFEQTK